MRPVTSISVVLPTYNCRPLLDAHLRSMQAWLDLVDEVIVVDSRSTDGTLDLIRSQLRHPKLRIIERDRGLYASWNEGIAATTGDWVYISTAGDTIERSQLLRLRSCGVAASADIVVSPCEYVNEERVALPAKTHRNHRIHREMSGRGTIVLPPDLVHYFAFRSAGTHALLGSCASDLFRGDFLRARPFPTDYGTHGDTAWTLRHSHEIRLCLVPEAKSTFCVHAKEKIESQTELMEILDRMFATEIYGAGKTPVARLALAVRMALRRRRATRKKPRLFFIWAYTNFLYLSLRAALGLTQSLSWLKLRGQVSTLSPVAD